MSSSGVYVRTESTAHVAMTGVIAVSMNEQSRKSVQHSTASANERDAKKAGDVSAACPRNHPETFLSEIHVRRVSGDFAAERCAMSSAPDRHAATAISTGTIVSMVSAAC